ncbi:TIGR03943 family putative permease subunit [Streptomyces lavendulae]|uniref:TIGR03943 family putative permease subunit n=1 Tax=Streptomyces lavendulae TaxID=1914 RepID=UPI00249FB547|nr:TIGR03943 family protein [Streptomyces lavendulae]GLX19521.1 TIGR03943 family protein [Streptomyces lavendulae subsp. lavendulae]GLX27016.1 TIGR03943 family protein [Streptomyces lavendulae subsp. lavendulae]
MTGRPPADAGHERLLSGLGSPLLLVLTGAGLLHVTVPSDVYLRYVKEGMWPYLVASGVLLTVLGFAGLGIELARRLRETTDDETDGHDDHGHDHRHDHGHDHGHGGAKHVAWLLAAPALTLLLVAPPALGSYTASRDGAAASGVEQTGYADLAGAEVTPMAMEEFIGRAVHAPKTLAGREVRLLGFVSAGKGPDTWYLNRLKLSCCAADARTLRVEMHGVKAPGNDTWVEVTGVVTAEHVPVENPVPTMEVGVLKPVAPPRNPYHDAPPAEG